MGTAKKAKLRPLNTFVTYLGINEIGTCSLIQGIVFGFLVGLFFPNLTLANSSTATEASEKLVRRHGGVSLNGFHFRFHNGTKEMPAKEMAEAFVSLKKMNIPAAASLLIETPRFSQILVQGPSELKLNTVQSQKLSLNLVAGSVQWNLLEKDPLEIEIKTQIWKQTFSLGAASVQWDSGLGALRWANLAPEFEIQLLDRPEKIKLGLLQKVTFSGRVEDGQLVYDVLLSGQKTPRGTFSPTAPLENGEKELLEKGVEKIFPSIFVSEKQILEEQLKTKMEQAKKVPGLSDFLREPDVKKIKKENAQRGKSAITGAFKGYKEGSSSTFSEPPLKPGYVCNKPLGKFNECLWKREGKQCIRYRCYADGKWADAFKLKDSANEIFCGKEPRVAQCDY